MPTDAPTRTRRAAWRRRMGAHLAAVVVASVAAFEAHAVDGVIEINQAAALAGGVTLLDTPGYPVTLSDRGSYRLTGELNVPIDQSGIVVQNNGITLDLNGFAIVGGGGTLGTGVLGVIGGNAVSGLRIHGGSVRNMGERGIDAGANSAVENVESADNGGAGIVVGDGSTVRHCRVTGNGEQGILGTKAHIESNVVASNDGDGIYSGSSVILTNRVSGNGGDGIDGFSASLVSGNVAIGNASYGITGEPTTGVGNNVTSANGGGALNEQINSLLRPVAGNLCMSNACP